MALACQRDSYLKKFKSKVKSVEKCSIKVTKKEKLEGFEVVLEDTILFPEGGGQPDDRGTMGGISVTRVRRDGAEAVHFLPASSLPFSAGEEVDLIVDWERRFDHMSQHSGQHLITAIADKKLNAPTTSWNLGEKISTIELDTPSLTPEQVQQLETLVNDKIRESLSVYPTLYPDKTALEAEEQEGFRQAARGLPDDHTGPLRVVTIAGVENNLCCGTHVANTSHLQAIKLVGVEKGKKGKTNLMFVAGGRVLKYLNGCLENEKALTGLLKGGPDSHVDLVDKLQKNFKNSAKTLTNISRELAAKEVEWSISNPPKSGLLSSHAKGDNEYMNLIVNGLEASQIVVFLTNGDEKKEGNFVLSFPGGEFGDPTEVAKEVMKLLDAKGFGKNGKWQGKVSKMSNRDQAEKLVEEWTTKNLPTRENQTEDKAGTDATKDKGTDATKDKAGTDATKDKAGTDATKDKAVTDATKDKGTDARVDGAANLPDTYPKLTLYTYPENHKAYKGLICAKYSSIAVTVADQPPDFTFGQTNKSQDFLVKFPNGKIPALEIHGESWHLNESNAIAEYLSSNDLKGKSRSLKAQSDQWIQFSSNQIVPPLSVWVFDVLGIVKTAAENKTKAQRDLADSLKILDDHLLFRTYLTQEQVSTCDIVVFCDLMLGFQHVFTNLYLKNFVNLKRWFNTIAKQELVRGVIRESKFLRDM